MFWPLRVLFPLLLFIMTVLVLLNVHTLHPAIFQSLLLLSLYLVVLKVHRNTGPLVRTAEMFSSLWVSVFEPIHLSVSPFCPPPVQVLKYTAGEINYGGRVTDDWDRRCLLSVLEDFYCPAVLSDDHVYSSSGVYRQIDTSLDIKVRWTDTFKRLW